MALNPKNGFDWDEIKSAVGKAVESTQSSNTSGTPPPRARIEEKRRLSLWPLAVVGAVALWNIGHSFIVVGAGERAVVFNRFTGLQKGQLGEGLHFLLPGVQYPTLYDIKTQTYTMSASQNESNQTIGNANDALVALTADGLPVSLEMSVQFHPDPEKVDALHADVGPQYVEKIVRPQTRAHVRMVVAKYPVTDVYGARRARIIEEVNGRLRKLFAQNNIVLDDALLRDVSFSEQFQQAIEQKQVAQQETQRMAFVVQQADKERRRKIIEAEGEAESIRLKARALAKNPQLTQYDYVQRLPNNVRTIVTDGRTILNLGDLPAATTSTSNAAVASEAPEPAATSGGAQ
jgi:prohibitin 2